MKTAIELKLTLTATIEKDEKTNLFSGWFEEFPQAIAIGEDEEDAKIKLMDAFKILLKARKRGCYKRDN